MAALCMIAICGGEVRAASVVDDSASHREAILDWTSDPNVTEVVRVPVEVARKFLFEKWPGYAAAMAQS